VGRSFGGHESKQRFNDLYLLDTEVRVWIIARLVYFGFIVLKPAFAEAWER
jgi:hypothetical protein